MIKACIFDLDGTLANSVNSIAYFINKEIVKYGMPEIPVNEFNMFLGDGTKKLVERALKWHNKKDSELEEKILKDYLNSYTKNSLYLCTSYEGIPELLQKLKEHKIMLAVLSNKPQAATENVLDGLFGKNIFSCILGARQGIPLKPAPDGVYEILKSLNLKKEGCLFIGDTPVDIQTGKNAGLSTIGVLWGFRTREQLEETGQRDIVEKPEEILKYIK